MALYLKVSNSLLSLAEGLVNDLQAAHYNVFQPYYIITQTEGMNNWLKHQQAYQVGIAANARFLKPNDLLFQLYVILGGPSIDAMSSQHLSWLIFKLLGEVEFISRYPDVAAYYVDHGGETDLKKMVLAEKVADLLDQYQVYRPEMIQEWNKANMQTLQTEEWQEWLWVRVKELSGNVLPDKTLIGNYILDTLANHPEKHATLSSRMPAIHLFGLSILTAFHVQILQEVAKVTDVHFHILNPAPGFFWFEDRNEKQLARWRAKGLQDKADAATIGNELLTGWGKVIQNSFGLFFANDSFLNAYEEIGVVAPPTDSLLHKIQHDIFLAATTDQRIRLSKEDLSDGSITVQACYTVAREVEALYNYLVHLSDQRKEKLSSRDIVVMVSDIDAYAPYIKAVFNHAPHRFRYTIADESYADKDNLFHSLQALLLLDEETFAAEAVMQLLDFSYIRKRFNLHDPVYLRPVVEAANIRFGIDGNKEDETRYVSWKYGIKRIMYGICMSGEPEFGEHADSFFPLDIAEGQDAYVLIRFCHFAQVLITAVEERREDRSIADWVRYVEQLLHALVYEQQDESDEDYTTLLKELSEFNLLHDYLTESVPYGVFVHSLLNVITGTKRSSLFANGGITFCSLIPMRSIPFKVVALLGLNHDKFPRKENKSSFDIMSKQPKRGDRNLRENDKHLFLETTISAQQYLYISYLGRSVNDNTAIPPSALVDELLDYIEGGYNGNQEEVRKTMIRVQPLQEFSRKYGQVPGLYSYLGVNTSSGLHFINPNKAVEQPQLEEFTLDMLTGFFKNPVKAYYNKVLGIYFNDATLLLGETELFSLDSLQEWQMKQQLLPADGLTAADRLALVKTGRLPLRNMAYVAVQNVEEVVQPARTLFEASTQGIEPVRLEFDLQLDEITMKCTLDHVYDGRLVKVSWSKRELKYLIEAYICYLAGIAAGQVNGLLFISTTAKNQVFEAAKIDREDALQRLRILKNLYLLGMTEILPFSPDFNISPLEVASINPELFAKKIKETFTGMYPNSDKYMVKEFKRGYFQLENHAATFKSICEQVILPLNEIFPAYYSK